jgi:hypothetical protein
MQVSKKSPQAEKYLLDIHKSSKPDKKLYVQEEEENNQTRADLDCRSPGIQNFVLTLANVLTHTATE